MIWCCAGLGREGVGERETLFYKVAEQMCFLFKKNKEIKWMDWLRELKHIDLNKKEDEATLFFAYIWSLCRHLFLEDSREIQESNIFNA